MTLWLIGTSIGVAVDFAIAYGLWRYVAIPLLTRVIAQVADERIHLARRLSGAAAGSNPPATSKEPGARQWA